MNFSKIYFLFSLAFAFFISSNAASEEKKNYFRIGFSSQIEAINPITTRSTFSANLLNLVFDPLVHLSDTNEIIPFLARGYQKNPQETEWIFELHQSIKFHDGHILDAEDIKFTFDVLRNNRSELFFTTIENIKEIQVLDKHTVKFVLKRKDQTFPSLLRRVFIAPSHLLQSDGSPKSQDYLVNPIGTGPFYVGKFSKTSVLFLANQSYFDGKPKLSGIDFKVYAKERLLFSSFVRGELDAYFGHDFKSHDIIERVPELKPLSYGNYHLYAIFLNLNNPLFKNKETRQALNYAVDKLKIMSKLVKGKSKVACSVVSPGYKQYEACEPYQRDYQKSLEILKSQNWQRDVSSNQVMKGDRKFSFTVLVPKGENLSVSIMKFVQRDLLDLGIQLTVETLNMPEIINKVFKAKKYDAVILPFSNVYGPAADQLYWNSRNPRGINFTSYKNQQVDDLLDKVQYSQTKSESQEAYRKFQNILRNDPSAIYLFWKELYVWTHKRVKGYHPKVHQLFTDMHKVELVQ